MYVRMSPDPEETSSVDYSEDFNQMWNVVYKLQAAIQPIMPTPGNTDRVCPKSESDSCPSGHMLVPCHPRGEYYCKQCSDNTFQPNENWITDKCRLRQQCTKPHMRYADPGSTVRDAACACMEGYHFPNEDQRVCLLNKICPKGTAHGVYGNCESCLRKSMYSDTVGRAKKCKPLTNCEKQNRCSVVPSNGDADNVCGPEVKDLTSCEDINVTISTSSTTLTIVIVGSILAALLLLVILLIFIFFWRRRQLRHKFSRRLLTEEEMEELQQKIIKESDRDPSFCRKVMSTSCSFVEEKIGRQIWELAQVLFRTSTRPGHFEQLVDKYKGTQAKYTVNGYLNEWKLNKGDNKDAVAELFKSLRIIKRDDLANEICLCLMKDVEFHPDNSQRDLPVNTLTLKQECVFVFLPCSGHKEKHKLSTSCVGTPAAGEAGTKLLAIATDDLDQDEANQYMNCGSQSPTTNYPSHPSPSAPVLEEANNVFPTVDVVRFNRQLSQPVQATS